MQVRHAQFPPWNTPTRAYFIIEVFFSFKRKIVEKVLGITYTRDSSYLQNFKKRFLLIGMKVLITTGNTCIRQPLNGPVKSGIIGQVNCMQIMMFMYQSDLKHSFLVIRAEQPLLRHNNYFCVLIAMHQRQCSAY